MLQAGLGAAILAACLFLPRPGGAVLLVPVGTRPAAALDVSGADGMSVIGSGFGGSLLVRSDRGLPLAALLAHGFAEVTSIGALVEEITVSARRNAVELTGLRQAFGAIDRSTQQNAAMVEESNAAMRNLVNQANALIAAIERFHAADAHNRTALLRAA